MERTLAGSEEQMLLAEAEGLSDQPGSAAEVLEDAYAVERVAEAVRL